LIIYNDKLYDLLGKGQLNEELVVYEDQDKDFKAKGNILNSNLFLGAKSFSMNSIQDFKNVIYWVSYFLYA
jgi:hypothetical protein